MSKSWCAAAIAFCALALNFRLARAQRVEFPSPVSTYGTTTQPVLPQFDPYAIPPNTPPLAAPALPPGGATYAAPGRTPYRRRRSTVRHTAGSLRRFIPTACRFTTVRPSSRSPTPGPKPCDFFQEVHLDETWLPRFDGDRGLGINTINTWVTFAIPFCYNANPLLITPGFQLYLWDGPDATGDPPPTLPGSTYGAYLDVAWNPQINNWFGAELEVSPGVYTDFSTPPAKAFACFGSRPGAC